MLPPPPRRLLRVAGAAAALTFALPGLGRADSEPEETASTRAADQTRAVAISGFLQGDLSISQESEDQIADGDGAPRNRDLFSVPRSRIRATGGFDFVDYVLELDMRTTEGMTVGLRHTEVQGSWEPLGSQIPLRVAVGAGLIPAPFGYEVFVERDSERLFAERAQMSDAFFPGQYDLGARGAVEFAGARLTLAVQNGEPLGSQAFPSRDPNSAKDYLARLEAETDLGPVVVGGGASAIYGKGFHPGTPPTKDTIDWRDLNEDGIVQLSEIVSIQGTAGTPSESFKRWGGEVDLHVAGEIPRVGTLTGYGEAAIASNLDRGVRPADPVLLGRDQRALGALVALVQEIGAHVLVGARYDYYRPEIDNRELQNGNIVRAKEIFHGYTGSVAVRKLAANGREARLTATYVIQDDRLGRNASGRPADLRNNIFILRAMAVF